MPAPVTDKDRGFRKLKRDLVRHRKGSFVQVGIQGTEAAQKRAFNQTNVTLAAVHEFGSRDGRIPQRSFIRAPMDRERKLFERLLTRFARGVPSGGSLAVGLSIVGQRAVAEMVRTIDNSIGIRRLAKSTLRRRRQMALKGRPASTVPLIDTGVLKGSITYKVVL